MKIAAYMQSRLDYVRAALTKDKAAFTREIRLGKIVIVCGMLLLSVKNVITGNILFHTDIGRDFMLMKDIVEQHHIQLIGASVRGQNGLFHGSLWYYLNLPVFILSGGNPAAQGYFWLFLMLCTLGIIYYVACKIFDKTTAFFAMIFFWLTFADQFAGMYNPHGALMVFPLYFYVLYRYLQRRHAGFMALAFLLAGVITQFHLGFGVLTFMITCSMALYVALRYQKYLDIFTAILYGIPLLPFVIFDMRHNYLQLHSIANIITGHGNNNSVYSGFWSLTSVRFTDFFISLISYVANNSTAFSYIIIGLIILTYTQISQPSQRLSYTLFFGIFLAYFVLLIPYTSIVPVYYIWALYPLVLMFFANTWRYLDRKIIIVVFASIMLANLTPRFAPAIRDDQVKDPANWLYYSAFADKIISAVPANDFGYYILSKDQFGYSINYAMQYESQRQSKVAHYSQKRDYTVLIIAVPQKEQHEVDAAWYVKNKIKITMPAIDKVRIYNGSVAFVYKLDRAEQAIPSDEDINIGIKFR